MTNITSIQNKKDFLCSVCGSNNIVELYPDTLGANIPKFGYNFSPEHSLTYRIVVCKNCSHGFCSPRPIDIYTNYNDIVDEVYLKNKTQRIETSQKVLTMMRKYIQTGNLLDVGCATGDFISVAKSYFNVEGLELSQWAVAYARKAGLTVHNCLLSDIAVSNHYDVVTLWGVIEHFDYPDKELSIIYRLLKKGGYVFLWTGDRSSWLAKLLGKNWWYYQGQHIQYFTKKSLIKLFSDLGFHTIQIGIYPYVMSMESIVNSLRRYPLIGTIFGSLVKKLHLTNQQITLRLPGEMFCCFRKI